jgi:serine/threonine protein kinase/DNA-binding winged helix-turn-helix (wHTH) protein
MSGSISQLYEFGPFRLDPREHLLLRESKPIPLTPKAFDTLLALVENSRHVMSKDELMRRVWPDTYVEESNLAQNISTIRKALGERDDGGHYIETVPKRGYRFVVRAKKVRYEPTSAFAYTIHGLTTDERHASVTNVGEGRKTGPRLERLANGARLDRYDIISPLGAGGMGEVYLARDVELGRRVALKLLSEQFTRDPVSLKRFVREAKAASALNHPNILTVYEIKSVEGLHFIATEYIEGETISQRIGEGPLEIAVAIDIATQISSALFAAHTSGIVHRDIKPGNIMLRPDGYVKLLDFGVAKLIEPRQSQPDDEPRAEQSSGSSGSSGSLRLLRTPYSSAATQTDSGLIMGTLDYMSPEQARGLKVDARSDIFSLGVVFYEMIAGHPPFRGNTRTDVLMSLLSHDAPSLGSIRTDVPPMLDAVVSRMLSKEPRDRYQSVAPILADLKKLSRELEIGDLNVRASQQQLLLTPEVRYARSGDVNIAYQVVGDAPIDLVFVMGWVSHLEYFWTEPHFARFLSRLASFSRLIVFDKRGTGLSDRVPMNELPTLEQRMDDVRAVLDAVGSEHAVLCGVSEGGPLCSLFAATYPEKVTALVMIGTYAKRIRDAEYPWAPTADERAHFFEEIRKYWGGPVGIDERAPTLAGDQKFREWWSTYLRMGASPGAALGLTQMNAEIDVRQILPSIRVPALIIHRTDDDVCKVEEGRFVARQIPGAKMVELPGSDHLPFVGDQDAILDEIEEFLTGVRHPTVRETTLATVLVTRVSSMQKPTELFEHLREHVRRELELFNGRRIRHEDGSVTATFDGPARAVRAAIAISDAARRLGIVLQCGLHTGECEISAEIVRGLAMRIGEQLSIQAAPGEVLVSGTVKDLVAGSGLRFEDRGSRILPGIPGECRLFTALR